MAKKNVRFNTANPATPRQSASTKAGLAIQDDRQACIADIQVVMNRYPAFSRAQVATFAQVIADNL